MPDIFSVQTIMVTIFGYPMSYIEFFGTIFNLWCVWLAVKSNILNWPVGIIGVIFFGVLFWEIGLYSDLFIQVYFFVTSIWGWWLWTRPRDEQDAKKGERRIVTISWNMRVLYVVGIILGTMMLGTITRDLPNLFPSLFPTATAYPYLDAFITSMSLAATILMARKELECWILWIAVDVLSTGLYWAKDVRLISVLYLIFLVLASKGLINWYHLLVRDEEMPGAVRVVT